MKKVNHLIKGMRLWFRPILTALLIAVLAGLNSGAGVVTAQVETPQTGEAVYDENGLQNEIQLTGCAAQNFAPLNAAFEQRVVELVNDTRAQNNPPLPPLKRNDALDYAARFHARDMKEDNYFSHDSQDRSGSTLTIVCSWSARIGGFYLNRSRLGENIAAGYADPQTVMNGWMGSSGHRANILNSNYREIGVGYWDGGGSYQRYWVQNFGSRSAVFPIVINREYAQTSSPDVNLYIYGQGTWDEMRLRNDDGAWGAWQPFRSSLTWRLNWLRGVRTVSVELRRSGQSTVTGSSDTIELTTNGPRLAVQPHELVFLYDRSRQQLFPPQSSLTAYDADGGAALTWNIAITSGDWFQVSPQNGTTPGSARVSVAVNPSLFINGATFNGSLTVSASGAQSVADTPQTIPLRLLVVENVRQVYLPLVGR
ncbi:MAG: CAP domain-containing protein [Chloroflexota bacterium]